MNQRNFKQGYGGRKEKASSADPSLGVRIRKDFIRNRYAYLIIAPVLLYYLLFHYMPMYGAIIAFKSFNPALGIMESEWVGFKYFIDYFQSFYFFRLIRNTILISLYGIIFSFPAPIILALLLNELVLVRYKRVVQTITYIPHFISMVVVCGIIVDFMSTRGVISGLVSAMGGGKIENLLLKPELFRVIYIASDVWKEVGWGSIIYLAALSGIDSELYEAARIDGANRWGQLINVTLPGILPTVMILLILRIGGMMNVGFEKIILLYNPKIYETADVISTFVYRRGILNADYSYASAVGLFNSVISFILVISANWLSKRATENSLW